MELFDYPQFSSQIIYEIIRDGDISGQNLTYSNYNVSYYYNNKLLLNITFDKFLTIIEEVYWDEEKMDKYCIADNNKTEYKNETDNETENKNKNNNNESSLIMMIAMGCLLVLFIFLFFIR